MQTAQTPSTLEKTSLELLELVLVAGLGLTLLVPNGCAIAPAALVLAGSLVLLRGRWIPSKAGNPTLLVVALCGMGFFGNMGWGPLTSVPAELFSPEVYGKAMGFVNASSYMVTGFSAKIFSSLVVETDAGKDFTQGWYFIAFCVAIGVVAASFIHTRLEDQPIAE